MKLDLKNTFILSVAALSLHGCISEDTAPCPPLSMVFDVQERLYDKNKDNDENLNCPPDFKDPNEGKIFGELIPTLYYILRDYQTGEVVREMHLSNVDINESTHTIRLDDELPYGKYILTAWGGIDNESQLSDLASKLDLSDIGHEMYMTNDTIDYNYNNDTLNGHFRKVNGMVVIETQWETFPTGFDTSDKTFYNVQSTVSNQMQYSDTQDINIHKTWVVDQNNKVLSTTVLPPSQTVNGTRLHIRYYKSSEPDSPGIVPDDINLTVRRNSITYLRFRFDPFVSKVVASIYLNGQWQEINNMKVD